MSASSQVPQSRSSRHQASNAPGTTAGNTPVAGIRSMIEIPELRQRRRLRRHALAADDMLRAGSRVVQDDRRVAARAVQVRLGHLQGERGGAGGIERIAAAFQHRHADLAGQPMRAGDHAEGAGDLRDVW